VPVTTAYVVLRVVVGLRIVASVYLETPGIAVQVRVSPFTLSCGTGGTVVTTASWADQLGPLSALTPTYTVCPGSSVSV
jgi:hypothetical protein